VKKIPTLLLALLILTAISAADTIYLTSASGQIYPSNVAPGFSFDLRGSGYNFSFTALDNFNGDLVNCIPCEPTQLGNLFLAGGPYLYLNNQVLDGIIQFDAISFVSSLAPSGNLTVKFTATPFLYLFLQDLDTSLEIGPFVWGNSNHHWYVTAQFRPDVGLGVYEFTGATFTSVPEPATMMLVGTGTLPIVLRLRRRVSC
jgi:hypothetical protein